MQWVVVLILISDWRLWIVCSGVARLQYRIICRKLGRLPTERRSRVPRELELLDPRERCRILREASDENGGYDSLEGRDGGDSQSGRCGPSII